MKMRKTISIFTAVCAVLAFTGMAMAENRIEVKVTSEPISYKAVCDKAGGFSLEFDSNTILLAGDQITIDLDYTSPSDLNSICKDIDLIISMDGAAGTPTLATATPFTAAAVDPAGVNPTTSPLYYVDDPTTANDLTQGAGGGIFFHVYGSVATQRITIDVIGAAANSSLIVGPDPLDKLVLVFLDQKTNPIDFIGLPGIYADPDKNGTYAPATVGDNTLCINVSQWSQSTVKGNMDSQADKYTFIPSNPQIAHVAAATTYNFAYCTKTGTGRIACGEHGGQGGADDCTAFDYEDADGYIPGTGQTDTNRVIIQNSTAFANTNYQVQLEILVNGIGGDNGVYFSNEAVLGNGFDTSAAACAAAHNAMPALGAQANYTYLNGLGTALAPANIEAPHAAECDVATTARAVTLKTDADTVLAAVTNDFIMVNLPAFNYDIDDITADDVVTVRVTLIKAPCGQVFQGDVEIGTMCAEAVVPVLTANTVVFPYFTAMANDNWWDGFVVTNLSAAEGHFTALVYEQDGDVGAFTGTIDANSLYQGTLANALAGATQISGAGTLGDSLCYILVCTDFTADGFAFMGSLSTNSLMANESMGYVPRVDYYNNNDSLPFCDNLNVTPGEVPAL